ncbi:aminopeptidase N [Aquiluna borgnonia]|uniref:Aminopeptidase N n=1 Tax=Aquiluna borgnonia TaxID=2499157 RepID=A0A7D4PQM6_9MICO|nr:aminopeptidase N [Aquiluna borgnonia]QKJ25141.1 aminopeptidase N [Aquiluna borgnonia]
MPGENLTRLEAQQRAEILNVHRYQVHLDVSEDSKYFSSDTTIEFDAKAGSSTFIDAITHQVSLIELNGEVLDNALSDGVRISLPNLQTSNRLRIKAVGIYSNTGEGLHKFVDPVDGEVYLYTQFEVPDSRRMFPVFEQPDLKAVFEFSVTAPKGWKVISNSPTPEPSTVSDTLARWDFAPTPRISSYITALIAGPYSQWNDSLVSLSGKVIPLGVFCRSSLAEFMDPDYIFEKTKQGFAYFEKAFDFPYPFEKYDQLWVPDFNAGAMENAGAVTFTESYLFRSAVTDATKERRVVTILHELAHMWFGDLVTMRWWNDLWLNESFAEYASTLATADATEWDQAWTTFASLEKNWAYRQDQLPSTHPIVAQINDLEDVQVNFDGITYAKGASVLKQLVAWVGQEPFLRGVASYFKKHQWQNTELKDLLVELERESGRDLSSWSKLWLETAGVNTLKPIIETDSSGLVTSFKVEQTAIAEHPTIRPHRMGIGYFNLAEGKLVREHAVEVDIDGPLTEIAVLNGTKRPDFVLLNDQDLAYAKVRLDEPSRLVALGNLSSIEDSLARTLVWTAAWDATRDGEAPARDFIDLVLNHIGPETESTTILTLLRQLVTTGNLYVAQHTRSESLEKIASGLISLAETAPAGSDSQLQFVKFVPQFARTKAHQDWMRSLLNGSKTLAGFTVDQDVRWELVSGLTINGVFGESEIAEELERDNTANGQKFAAAARAAIPTPENKRATWDLLVGTEQYSNTLVNSASLAFGRVNDLSLLGQYLDEYHQTALDIWTRFSYKIAEYLLINLYPVQLASAELAAATKALIETEEVSSRPALRRILVENLAGVERALVAQRADR